MAEYNLYAAKIKSADFPIDERFSYYNSMRDYILVFSDHGIKGFTMIPEETIAELKPDELNWLTQAKALLNIEHMDENEDDYMQMLMTFADKLEEELKTLTENAPAKQNLIKGMNHRWLKKRKRLM